MQAFITEATNRPGEFARVAAAIAAHGINVEPICLTWSDRGSCAFFARDEAGVRSALTEGGFTFREVPSLTIALEDRPGTAAQAAQRLADAGVNIELFCPVDFHEGRRATIAVGVDKIEEARRALSDLLTEWSLPAERVHAGAATR